MGFRFAGANVNHPIDEKRFSAAVLLKTRQVGLPRRLLDFSISVFPIKLPDILHRYLCDAASWKHLPNNHPLGGLNASELIPAQRYQLLFSNGGAGLQFNPRCDCLAPFFVWNSYNCAILQGWMPPNYLLNLTGKYIEASADNEVLPTCRSCP
jgi:hypothetical protein